MARKRSALKAFRVAARRRERNRPVRSALRTYVSRARRSIEAASTEQASELVKIGVSQLDKAASKGIIHPNQAARRKSRLMHRLAAAVAARALAEAAVSPGPAPRRRARTAAATAGSRPRTVRAAAGESRTQTDSSASPTRRTRRTTAQDP